MNTRPVSVFRLFSLLVAVLALGSCAPAGPMIAVARGNFAYARGDYQAALVHYLAAEQDDAAGWVLFNTANVYYALGEQEAALAAWSDARTRVAPGDDASPPEINLVHAASFNRGVLYYERGQYRAAYDEFRYALSLAPSSAATKRNLELALERSRAAEGTTSQAPGIANEPGAEESDASTLRILEYVRRKEAEQWFANREQTDTDSVRDW